MAKGHSLQEPFLNALRKERIPVSIYLVNGIKLQGHIDSFDQFVVLLRNSVSQMIYKHAISTIVPARNVRLNLATDQSLDDDDDDMHTAHEYPDCSGGKLIVRTASRRRTHAVGSSGYGHTGNG